ncbi:antibiotic biosynthesis monooxygenase [Inhella sp.]|uniref:antibiotic biosynthesis monooxygenase family protein n=1 Tax=Inhella sp. TaxID=1921806 RepID=UPI0035B0425B
MLKLPNPCYAVIFTSQRRPGDEGYAAAAEHMVELVKQQPGFIDVRSVRGADGLGITVSYWASLEAIAAWHAQAEHAATRERGRAQWYAHYELQVVKVERAYDWQSEAAGTGS